MRKVLFPLDQECRSTIVSQTVTIQSSLIHSMFKRQNKKEIKKNRSKIVEKVNGRDEARGNQRGELEWGKREQRKSREWKTSDEKNRARKEKRRSSKRSVERRRGWWGVITGVLRQNGLIVRASWSAAILRRVLREYSLCVPRLNSYFLSLRVFPLP